MSERNFQLQRFYFGLLAADMRASGKPLALGRTAGITSDQIAECLSLGRLEPPSPKSSDMPAALGLFRGRSIDYILTIAQVNAAGLPQLLYILLDSAVVAWLGGNLTPFLGLAHSEMPVFDAPRESLPPFNLNNPQPADAEMQVELIQDLLLYCQDNMKAVEGLLTALVQGQNIAIANAPASLEKRLRFVEGLVCLLPMPARVVLTFATHVGKPENSTAQIKFLGANVTATEPVIFDWESAALTPASYERHDYARFIISQLRLDPAQAVDQAESLARTASWRAVRKETLSTALQWVSRRAKVDSALRARQPADRDTVAAILREDPTLTDELRALYSTHLVSFALPLREWKTADIVPALAASNREVAEAIFADLRNRVAEQPLDVYDLLEHWLLAIPEAKSLPWQQVLYNAAFAQLQKLIASHDPDALAAFLYRMCNVERTLQLDKIAAKVILQTRALAHQSPQVAQAVLVLAADHLAAGSLQELIGDEQFVKQLPRAQQKAIALLQPEVSKTIQPLNALAEAAASVPTEYQSLVTVRFVELALHLRRPELIGDRELQLMLQLSTTRQSERFQYVMKYLIDEFSQASRIKLLGSSGLGLLPQLYFIVGSIGEGIKLLEHYQNVLFTVERLAAFSDLIGEIFLRIDLSAEQLVQVLAGFENSQIRNEARARAFCASLINQHWDVRLESVARSLTNLLYHDAQLLRVIGLQNGLRLLQFHSDRLNALESLRVSTALMHTATRMGENGPPLMLKCWQQLNARSEMRNAGLELLRRYVRLLPPEASATLPDYFAAQIDAEVGEALRTTQMIRIITGGHDFIKLSEAIHVTLALLRDLAITYHESKELPTVGRLRRDLDAMPGGVTEQERQELATHIAEIAQLVYQLGTQHPPTQNLVSSTTSTVLRAITGKTSTSKTSTKGLLKEARETPPQTATEFLNWFGLNFTDTLVVDLDVERISAAHVLGERAVSMLYREAIEIVNFLRRLALAFPEAGLPAFSAASLKSEVDVLWSEIKLFDQKRIQSILGEETQRLSLLIRLLANRSSDRAVVDSGSIARQLDTGRRQPTNELEALRWIGGYFGRKHQN